MRIIKCSKLPNLEACSDWESDGGTSKPADLGTKVHDALARFIRGEEVDVEGEAGKLVEAGIKAWDAINFCFLEPKVEEEVKHWTGKADWELRGHPDVVSWDSAVLDWKTGWRQDRDYELQLLGYALCAGAKKAVIVWLRDYQAPLEVLDVPPAAEIEARIDRIIEREGEARPGEQCAWCKYRVTCEEKLAADRSAVMALSVARDNVPVKREELAELYPKAKALSAALGAYGETLRRDIEANGPLVLSDTHELQIVETPRSEIAPAAAWALLSGMLGEDLASAVKIVKGRLEVAVKAAAKSGDKQRAWMRCRTQLAAAGAMRELKPVRAVRRVKREQPASTTG